MIKHVEYAIRFSRAVVRGALSVIAALGLIVICPSAAHAGIGKVTICHIPPGNPANAHTITVGFPAVVAHLAHGDSVGACGLPEE